YRRDLLALVHGELRDTGLTRREPHQKPEPFGIAERPEHLCSGFDLNPRRKANGSTRWVPTMQGCQFRPGVLIRTIHGIIRIFGNFWTRMWLPLQAAVW